MRTVFAFFVLFAAVLVGLFGQPVPAEVVLDSVDTHVDAIDMSYRRLDVLERNAKNSTDNRESAWTAPPRHECLGEIDLLDLDLMRGPGLV